MYSFFLQINRKPQQALPVCGIAAPAAGKLHLHTLSIIPPPSLGEGLRTWVAAGIDFPAAPMFYCGSGFISPGALFREVCNMSLIKVGKSDFFLPFKLRKHF